MARAVEEGADRLRRFARTELRSGAVVVVSNREPYSHEWTDSGDVAVERPASGLVTGIEPVLRASGGTWIAYASGSADDVSSDEHGRLAVPPETAEYTLRRISIDPALYQAYYCGFANEALWPLCHTAHVRPACRASDWDAYQSVNQTFADAAADESAVDGLVLVQDYHLALVPRMIRERASHLVTNLFWHIPWPNPEIAGICPWKEMLLEGMLGADVIGFHTQQFCMNFLDTVDRYLECRVDRTEMTVRYAGHRTRIRRYPISVEWPYPAASRAQGERLRETLGLSPDVHVILGVDRADYTKGLLERVEAIEMLLADSPELAERFVFVQLASPTRTRIPRYRALAGELEDAVQRVNERFGNSSWRPIVLQMRTFPAEEVRTYYAMANSALVTPLHDGMNLVAKEYVAACADGDGALVLSEFAGASKELDGALIVNPYDTAEVARAILRAIRMPAAERRARMESMRRKVASNSIYDWSEKLLRDLIDLNKQRSRYWPARKPAGEFPRAEVAG